MFSYFGVTLDTFLLDFEVQKLKIRSKMLFDIVIFRRLDLDIRVHSTGTFKCAKVFDPCFYSSQLGSDHGV